MKDVYPGESRYVLEPFCVDNGRLEFFDLGKSPIRQEHCLHCGLCYENCPAQAITRR